MGKVSLDLAGDNVYLAYAVYLVAEELHPYGCVGGVCGIDLHNVSPDTEFVSHKVYVVSLILDAHKLCYQLVTALLHPLAYRHHHRLILGRVTQRIDTGHAGDNYNVTAFHYGRCGRVTKLIYLVIYRGVLLDVNILAGDIGLRLVIVIIGHKVFNCVLGEKLPEFGTQLSRQYFIVGKNKGGPVKPCDNVRHREGLSRAGNAHKRLLLHTALYSLDYRIDCLGLVARKLIVGHELESVHLFPPYQKEHSFFCISLIIHQIFLNVKCFFLTISTTHRKDQPLE